MTKKSRRERRAGLTPEDALLFLYDDMDDIEEAVETGFDKIRNYLFGGFLSVILIVLGGFIGTLFR